MQYYVYAHVDPETNSTVYVGKGCKCRAWSTIGRSWDHHAWLTNILLTYTMDQIVVLLTRGLDDVVALALESDAIAVLSPKFNRRRGRRSYEEELARRKAESAGRCLKG